MDDHIVEHDNLDVKEEDLVNKTNEIFMNMNPAIFKRSWINTGLMDEKEFEGELEEVDDEEVADCILEKEEEEELVEHFMALQIDETRVAAPMNVEHAPEVQVTDEADAGQPSTSKWPTKQSTIKDFFNRKK